MERYFHHFWTGSGSNRVELTIDGYSASLSVRTNWMGEGLKRYNLRARHQSLSPAFGVLVVEEVETAAGEEAPLAPAAIDEEDVLLPFVIEYVKVPTSPVYVHENSQNVEAGPMGYAGWNESFDLALLVHDSEGRPGMSPLAEICNVIDKAKLVAWSGDELGG